MTENLTALAKTTEPHQRHSKMDVVSDITIALGFHSKRTLKDLMLHQPPGTWFRGLLADYLTTYENDPSVR